MTETSYEIIIKEQESKQLDDEEHVEVKDPYGFVYITTNLMNGHRYLGQKTFNKGWENYLGSGTLFKRALKKYGKENFKQNIIDIAYSEDELNQKEYDYSVFFDVVQSNDWYNLVFGGGSTSGYRFSEEQKMEFSKRAKERFADPTNHPMYGKPGMSGKNNPMYGISPIDRMDEETYKQWKKHLIENVPRGEDSPLYGVSLKERLGEEGYVKWRNSQKAIDRAGSANPMYGISPQERMDEKTFQQWLQNVRGNVPRGENHPMYGKYGIYSASFRPIYCIELDEIFWGPTDAKNKYQFNMANITNCCMRRIQSAGKHPDTKSKLHWLYVNDKVNKDKTVIRGAITLGYITEERFNDYLDSIKLTIQN